MVVKIMGMRRFVQFFFSFVQCRTLARMQRVYSDITVFYLACELLRIAIAGIAQEPRPTKKHRLNQTLLPLRCVRPIAFDAVQ